MQHEVKAFRNFDFMLSVYQKNKNVISESPNLYKFMENKGIRPDTRLERNANNEMHSFHNQALSLYKNGLKLTTWILMRILKILEELIAKLAAMKKNRPGYNSSSYVKVTNISYANNVSTIKKANTVNMSTQVKNTYQKTYNVLSNIYYYPQDKKEKKDGLLDKIKDKLFDKIFDKVFDAVWDKIFSKKSKGSTSDNFAQNALGAGSDKAMGSMGKKAGRLISGIGKAIGGLGSKGTEGIGKLSRPIMGLIGSLSRLRVVTMFASVAQGILNTIMSLNPIVLVILGIMALVTVIALLVKNWDSVTQAVRKLWDTLVSTFSNIGQWFYNTVVKPILNIMPDWMKKLLGISNHDAKMSTSFQYSESVKTTATTSSNVKKSTYSSESFTANLPDGSGMTKSSFDFSSYEKNYFRDTKTASNKSLQGNLSSLDKPAPKGGNIFNITINGINKSTNEIVDELVKRIKEASGTMGEVAV